MAPEISTPRPYDEARLARASKLVQASYAALNLALLTHYALSRDLYHTGLALGTLALFPVMHVFYRLTRLKRVHQMDIFIYIFTLIAYTGGELLGGYARLRAYDKLAHMLSGSFVYLLAHPLFYFLKANHAVEKSDRNLLMVFCAATSLCVAGLWEIGEYFLSMLTGIDMQRVATMGIHDSMQDMIVCLIGTVALLPPTCGTPKANHIAARAAAKRGCEKNQKVFSQPHSFSQQTPNAAISAAHSAAQIPLS